MEPDKNQIEIYKKLIAITENVYEWRNQIMTIAIFIDRFYTEKTTNVNYLKSKSNDNINCK